MGTCSFRSGRFTFTSPAAPRYFFLYGRGAVLLRPRMAHRYTDGRNLQPRRCLRPYSAETCVHGDCDPCAGCGSGRDGLIDLGSICGSDWVGGNNQAATAVSPAIIHVRTASGAHLLADPGCLSTDGTVVACDSITRAMGESARRVHHGDSCA